MGGKVNYTLVGLFVLLLGAGFIATVLWLTARTDTAEYDTYVAYFSESVSGLNPKASVKYRGVEVGRVNRIALDRDNPERVQLLLAIERDTPVKEDTVAILSTQGITGLAYVELTGGSREAAMLSAAPGAPWPEIRTGPSLLVRLDTAVTTALTQLSEVAESFNRISERLLALLDADNQRAIAGTLANVESITGSLAGRMDALGRGLEELKVVLENTARASAGLPEVMRQAQAGIETVTASAASIDRLARDLDGVVVEGGAEMNRLTRETLAPLGPLLAELQRLVGALNRFTQDLEQKPNLLLLGRPAPAPGPGE
ncbi:MAG: MlaD family protein [Gammaproteobacteria bacterium]|nr:MlaD family protein [Gammaproteobacteria bacterium]